MGVAKHLPLLFSLRCPDRHLEVVRIDNSADSKFERKSAPEAEVLPLPTNYDNSSGERTSGKSAGQEAAYLWTPLLVGGFVVLDLALPLGVAAGVPYAVAVMAAFRTSDSRFIFAITALSVLLTLVGLFLSPEGGELWKVVANRALAVLIILGTGIFSENALRARQRAIHQAVSLEREKNQRIQLIRSGEARSEFLGQISHELRTPLTSLTTFARILEKKSESLSTDRIKAHSEVIGRNAYRLEVLIDDLFDASGTETGVFKLNLTTTDLPEVVSDAVIDYANHARKRDQQLQVDIDIPDGSNFHALADPARIAQIVTNLVSNASKYSRPGSVINVSCRLENDKYVVKITDHGDGINEDDLQKVFTPFFRVDNEHVRSVPGTGLGLTITRSIVELHDGSIFIESRIDVGTTVTFTIPAFPSN